MGQKQRSSLLSTNQAFITGLQKYLAKRSLMLGGKEWPAATIIGALTTENAMIAKANQDAAAWHQAVAALTQQTAENDQLRLLLRQALLLQFGNDKAVLAAFGISVPKRRAPTPPVKAAAAQKARATRAARHILGKREREAIVVTGSDTGNAVTSPAAAVAGAANGQTAK